MVAKKALVFAVIFLWGSTVLAGNTGKIAGKVVDKATGEPLIGANVMVVGTNLGAATDAKGRYYILQVPPGTYSVTAKYIGYHPMTVKGVVVQVDLTSHVNFALQSSAVEAPALTVTAEKPLVRPDVTSTRRAISKEEIIETPGFETTQDLFTLQGGVVVDNAPQAIVFQDGTQIQVRDESIKNIHIRGGRGGEILYVVDGVPVTHPIYGGRDVLDLNVVDVEQLELLTGVFNAEYGEAQSGVVNITTRAGTDYYEGGVEYKTSRFTGYYDSWYSSFYFGGPEPLTRNLLPWLGVHLPGKANLFLSGNAHLSDTPYNNHRTRDDISVLGIDIREKQDNTGNLNARFDWRISNQIRTAVSYHGTWKGWSDFNWLWKNYPDHMADYSRANHNLNLKLTHTLSKSTFYDVNLGYLRVRYKGSLNGLNPADFWIFYKNGTPYDYWSYKANFSDAPDSLRSKIRAPTTDGYGFFDDESYQSIWRNDATRSFTLKSDITSQVTADHLMKAGILVQYHDIHYVDIQDGGIKLSKYGEHVFKNEPYFPAPSGPFKEFGQNRWVFDAYPVIGGAYIQDKFERGSLIINAGVRTDFFMPGPTVMRKSWKQMWEAATGLKADWKKFRYKVSPRFGISFPISDKTVLFFAYGHFNQLPELQFFYRDPYTGGFTGNPHLDYEHTIQYEFGFTHQFAQNWALDIKSYNKDISKQVETTRLRAALGLPVDLYDSKGYARARGMEFEIIKRYSTFTSGKLTYTVQWATGYSSSAFENYIRSVTDFPLPIRERRLNWDIRHQVILQAMFYIPENRKVKVFGLKVPTNLNLTVISRYSSGQPYTPFTLDPVVAQKTENSATGPPTMFTDIKIRKGFRMGPAEFSIFADIFNVFNNRNVQIAYGFNTYTGKPYRYGDVDPQLAVSGVRQYISWHRMYNLMDPRQFSAGRHTDLGIRLDWRLD